MASPCRIEAGLVNDESPFRATRKFGISLVHQSGLAEVGTLLKIEQHKKLPDGQIVIVSRGMLMKQLVSSLQLFASPKLASPCTNLHRGSAV